MFQAGNESCCTLLEKFPKRVTGQEKKQKTKQLKTLNMIKCWNGRQSEAET